MYFDLLILRFNGLIYLYKILDSGTYVNFQFLVEFTILLLSFWAQLPLISFLQLWN